MITLQLTPEQFWCIYHAVLTRVDSLESPVYDASSDDFKVDEEALLEAARVMRLLKKVEQEQAIPF